MIDNVIDVGIITIIPTEINALLSVFGIKEQFKYSDKSDIHYLKTNIYSRVAGRDISIVVAFVNKEAGNTESAIVTTNFLHNWYPRLMCLVGICAGINGKTKIGDVILPSKIHDRQIKVFKNNRYSVRTTTYLRSDFIDGLLKVHGIDIIKYKELCKTELSKELSLALTVRDSLMIDVNKINENINILDGSLISDNILIRDSRYFRGVLTELDEKCRGADMEAAGFVRSCMIESHELPWIISRGVSDFGDGDKSDSFQPLAAKTACLALRELLVSCINVDNIQENIHAHDFENTFEFNILQQIQAAYSNKKWDEVCEIAPFMSRYLWISGQYKQRVDIGMIVIDSASHIHNEELRASYFIDDLGWTTFILGDKEKARTYIYDGLRITNEINNHYLSAKAHRHLASIYRRDGQIDEAKNDINLSLAEARQIADKNKKAEMLSTLQFSKAKIMYESNNFEEKRKSINEFKGALTAFKRNGDNARAAKVYSLLGNAYLFSEDRENAKIIFHSGLEAAYKIGRYDEIKSNTLSLFAILDSEEDKDNLRNKIIEYCKVHQLYSELNIWQKKQEDIYGKESSFIYGRIGSTFL
jgi:nucleoside phosphorylase/tetratricopeptide (TPR) repeat protein